jgi:WD40 repeat protein
MVEIATASRDGLIKLWDALSGQEVLTLYGDGAGVGGIALSSDGAHLAVAGEDAVRVYALQTSALLQLARTQLTRGWTTGECQTYLHADVCPSPEGVVW